MFGSRAAIACARGSRGLVALGTGGLLALVALVFLAVSAYAIAVFNGIHAVSRVARRA